MRFPVAKDKTAFVESLVGSKSHFEIVPDAHQEDASFGEIDTCLTNDLVEQFVVYFLTDGADAALAGLLLHELGLEGLFKFL